MTSWVLVDVETGYVVDLSGVLRLVDYDSLPVELAEHFQAGRWNDVIRVALDHGLGVDVYSESGYVELRTLDEYAQRVEAVRMGRASDFVVGHRPLTGDLFVCTDCSPSFELSGDVLTVCDTEPGELCHECGRLLAD